MIKKNEYEKLVAKRNELGRISKKLEKLGYFDLGFAVFEEEKKVSDEIFDYLSKYADL